MSFKEINDKALSALNTENMDILYSLYKPFITYRCRSFNVKPQDIDDIIRDITRGLDLI